MQLSTSSITFKKQSALTLPPVAHTLSLPVLQLGEWRTHSGELQGKVNASIGLRVRNLREVFE